MASISDLKPFIYRDPENPFKIIIDGERAEKHQMTEIDGDHVVQLGRARQDESHFDWVAFGKLETPEGKCKEVSIKKVMIIDGLDTHCLIWFIENNIKVIFSTKTIAVSPDASTLLTIQLNNLVKKKITVIKGSTITVAREQGFSGYGRSMEIHDTCKQLGFEVYFQ